MSTNTRITDRDIAFVRELNPIADVMRDLNYELEPNRDGSLSGLCMDSVDPATHVGFSFSVSPERGMYYCAHCQAGGDVITFVEKAKDISFWSAVNFLARRAGISLTHEEVPAP
ncbi:CHC2 zinc finger domain-containing protein [Nonomuraea sp. NPDC026600]|uniref:CHC2 zinc finger domain-containing protein n=1 Tax=Nonomuraea sp. NPDC026600 TaxID=3155363 RepID=UPI0033EA9BE2